MQYLWKTADPFIFFKDCLPQILFGSFMDTLSHFIQRFTLFNHLTRKFIIFGIRWYFFLVSLGNGFSHCILSLQVLKHVQVFAFISKFKNIARILKTYFAGCRLLAKSFNSVLMLFFSSSNNFLNI